ncbi:PREDICTED: neuron navigator 3 isoform X1 [Cercocebus atys]|uniref:Neuron navigator 3 n=1 Tax=Cercocebus atys TaxID=9531 RepID=A0A2K5LTK6_CERAT|nr:PREDICTED: neuron navigator 3 isoform X1 [Cercocebus atys]
MPVFGVASKLRQPAVGSKPVHTALPIPNLGTTGSQHCSSRPLELAETESSMLSCQLALKSTCEFGEKKPLQGKAKEKEDSKIYTDWANHYLAKSGHKRLIKDLQQDIADGVLLAEIIQIIANEKVEDINGCPRSQSQMIENVDVCLSFLAARGVNVQGLSAEEIRNGNLKAILGLFFSLSRYKQQQHHQQQYYQSLVELQQRVTHASPPSEAGQAKTQQDMQSSLAARYATQSNHSGIATSQKKPTRLPGPSRVPAAGSSSKVQGASNLNRRSQSFNSIDKNKPPNYANGNEKDSSKGPQSSSGVNGNMQPPSTAGQPPASAIPSPSASKPWRSKSMNVKHSATSTMLTVKQSSPATSPTPPSDRLKPPVSEGVKTAPSGQKSMLEKFKLVNARTALRPPQPPTSGPSDGGKDDDAFSESGEMEGFNSGLNSGGSTNSSPKVSPKLAPPKAGSKNLSNKKSLLQPKEKEEKNRDKNKVCTEKPVKEEKDQVTEMAPKKTSKIASLIPKGSKTTAAKKESLIPSSSGIPKPSSKVPTAKQTISPGSTASKESEKFRTTKGSPSQSLPKPITMEKASASSCPGPLEGREAGQASSASCTMTVAQSSGQSTGNGAVQLPQQQQHSHPNTATVAPFIYRAHSENEGTSLPSADSCTSPTKMDLSYSKTAKQCLEEISGEDPETRRMRTVKNIADLRQNLEETMSSLRGTQISHSTLETTFDSTVTTEVNGRSIPNLTSRPTPMTWRLGQACPRLQAGDAPSLGAGYPRSGTSRFIHTDPSRFMYTTPLRRAAVSRLGNMSQIDMNEKASSDLDMSSEVDVGGYMSDGDILGKSLRTDDINSGYMTDGGLNLYTRSLNRIPDTASSRDVIQRGVHDVTVDADSWDDSSSVSSGLSDTLDNISTDDLNTSSVSSYSNITVPSRKNTQLKTDSEKRSTADETWDSPEELKKPEEDFDSHGDAGGKWKTVSSGLPEDPEKAGQKASLSVSQTGSWRRGMSAQGGAQSRQKAGTSALKTPGKTDDAKASEKGKAPLKGSSLQRSPSDAGKSSGDEGKKPPSGIGRSTATSSFGFKKPSGVGSSAMITSSGATITSGSATLGKIPKSAAIGGKSNAGRKTSLDGSQNQDDVVLHVSSKTTLQYRSLPRPSKSSTSGIPGRGGHRSSTSSIDSNVSSKSAGATTSKLREPTKIGSGRSSPVTVNQTDKEKEKVAVSDSESVSLSGSPKSSPTSASACGAQGLRQPGSKYPDIASPTFRRLFGAKAGGKSASAPNTEGVKSSSVMPSPSTTLARQGSLESPSSGTGSMGSAGGLSGSSSPLFNKPSDLTTDVISLSHSLASSPASVHSFTSGGLVWAANMSSSSAGSKDTPSYQSMTSLHTSSESIDLPLSHHGSLSGLTTGTHEVQSLLMRTGSVRSTLSESMQLDRNTLPKKGLRYTPSSRQANQEEGKEWLRSHSTGGLQDTGNQSPLVSPSAMSSSAAGKYHFSNLVSPTNLSQFNLPGPSMMRSNSIPAQDSSFDLYDDSQLCGSATSLEERPRAISHSGSFRDSMEEVHGSSLSLVSSTSSLYSTAEEKAHSEQIHKLRRELVASQEKVATLTSQLSANAHLVAAFEKSLGNMTGRLQSLTMTAEQKESELIELRETIEMLKAQNSAAQAAIQGALNGPDHPPKDLRIRRQHSSESVSSINSATSHSSIGSGNDADSKKKKKKNWVNSRGSELRSSFKQAFGKKKSTKPPSSHSDIEELTDSSLPASPKLPHNAGDCSSASMKPSQSASAICECTEAEAEIILQLKSELREKELKLTDIRLEALSSAHHLDQIREAMNRMQNEIEILKAENDRLKAETGNTAKPTRPPSESSSSTSSSSSRQSLGLSLNNLNITEAVTSDILLDDAGDATGHKDGRSVKIIVSISKGYGRAKDQKSQAYLIGSIGVSGKTKWDVLDGVIRRLFKEYVFRIDTSTSLGLSSDCIASYCIGDLIRSHNLEVPELLPCGYLVGDNNVITVNLKGVEENSLDSFVFDTLIPKPITQRYFNLLMEHHRIILSGPSGTGKTYLANKLAEYVITKSGRKKTEDAIATFNVDHKSSKELQQYLANLAEQCSADNNGVELPVVIILDNLHHVGSLSDIFNGFLNCKYNKCPYIIGTMNQGVSSSPNLELHHNFRWVLCANHTEPVKGFLGRYLRRKLIEIEIERNIRNNDLVKIIDWIPKTWHHLNSFLETHSSSDVTIGPRLFLPCPMDVEGSRVWFMDLWNYSLVPYILEAVREGLQMYGKRTPWEDPSKWVLDTYPWSSASLPQESPALLQLRPEDVGYEGCTSTKEATTSKHIPQTDTEGDPLMNMLMKLQEAANYSSTQSCDSESTSHHEDILDSSLESTL